MLHATNLSHSFDYPLFDSLNLSIDPGDTLSIMGVSGSGKSTLLHILSTFLPPKNGTVEILGHNIYSLKEDDIIQLRRKDIGIIFQSHYLFRGFSARENLDISALLSQQHIDHEMLSRIGIDHTLHQQIGELSGGQQQRLSIARVLTKKPKIIFADEPTGNLDKETATQVIDDLFHYVDKHRAALVLATHDRDLASRCSRRYRLENGDLSAWS